MNLATLSLGCTAAATAVPVLAAVYVPKRERTPSFWFVISLIAATMFAIGLMMFLLHLYITGQVSFTL